jgi:hypothetical protein
MEKNNLVQEVDKAKYRFVTNLHKGVLERYQEAVQEDDIVFVDNATTFHGNLLPTHVGMYSNRDITSLDEYWKRFHSIASFDVQ